MPNEEKEVTAVMTLYREPEGDEEDSLLEVIDTTSPSSSSCTAVATPVTRIQERIPAVLDMDLLAAACGIGLGSCGGQWWWGEDDASLEHRASGFLRRVARGPLVPDFVPEEGKKTASEAATSTPTPVETL